MELFGAETVVAPPISREAHVRNLLSSVLVSASLVSAPVMAAPSASALSLSNARIGAATKGENDLAEGAGGIIAIALVAGIVAIGVLAATSDDGGNDSVSN